MDYLRGLIGIGVIIAIAFLFSLYRKKVDWKLVAAGIVLQVFIALLISKVPFIQHGFNALGDGFVTFLSFASRGAEFLFGDLAFNSDNHEGTRHGLGLLFAFQALPMVLLFSSVTAGLYDVGPVRNMVD